jgi:membrane protein YqaA with SNARE-associated domain
MKLPLLKPKIRPFWKSVHLTHRFYQITGGYRFFMDGMRKLGWAMLVMGVVLWVLNKYVFDLSDIADWITNSLPWYLAAATLFASEIVVGFLPPDLFILWAQSLTYPWLMVLLLSVLSYLAGIVSYLIGERLHHLPQVQGWIDVKFADQFIQIRRFGGLLVVIAALTPLPFPMISTIAGMVGYRFRWYLMAALTRFLRFALYAAVIFGLV